MTIDFKLPKLDDNINSADVAEIHIAVGDTIEAGQVIMELETDKAVMELQCPHAGKITKILVKKGETISTGQPIVQLEPSGGGGASLNGGAKETKAASAGKAAPAATAAPAAATAAPPKPAPAVGTNRIEGLPLPAGPATRRLARSLGVNLASVRGTGAGGRITLEDVARAAVGSGGGGGTGGGIVIPPLPDFTQWGAVDRQPLTKLQKTSANNLTLAWQIIPHVTQHDLADVTELETTRRQFQESLGKGGPKVTMTAIALKAAVACLREFPLFNASLDSQTNELVLKRYYHIGVAVDTPNGLVVPVIRDVDKKTVLQLAGELTEMAGKARDRKLAVSEMMGGTFTITNLGGIGGTGFTPIVNYPEVAILGMSRSQKQLQLVDGQVQNRLMLPLSLSYDHRVINGADAARFVSKLCGLFSDSFRLLLEC